MAEKLICHYAPDLNTRAVCGVFPNWSTSSYSAVTCPSCIAIVEHEQEWFSLEILADIVPPEPETIGQATDCIYGACDLEHASAEELDIWWMEVKEIPFGDDECQP